MREVRFVRIKRVTIDFFAGIKNKTLDFSEGFNLIYGENERGKSSIESFIKVWLYGMDNSRGKFNDRKKYLPLSGEKISGELTVEYNGKGYIIKRTFGITKKEDTCELLDEITGEAIEMEYKNEPGRMFFNINSSTFTKTLFISQLGVIVSKDKEEEIMEKITNMYSAGDENISITKAIEKLEKRKKQLFGVRKSGEIDLLEEKRNLLNEELWEAYKLGEENIHNEENLIKKKQDKINIKEQIHKLDLYKKYIKKIKLQKDYKEICDYLIKGEELKKKEEDISGQLKKGNEFITNEFLDEISEKSSRYLSLLDVKQEKMNKLHELDQEYKEKNDQMEKYSVFTSMGNNIKEKIYTLKFDQQNLEGKLNNIINIQNSISRIKIDIAKQKSENESLEFIGKHRQEIEELLSSYKDGLKELKYKIENQESSKYLISDSNDANNKIFIAYVLGGISCLGFVYGMANQMISLMIVLLPLFLLSIKLYVTYSLEAKNNELAKKEKMAVKKLNTQIVESEEKLNLYIKRTKSKSYEEFINKLTKYDKYKSYSDNMNIIMNNKEEEIKSYNITELKGTYNKNKGVISSLYSVLLCKSLDEVLEKIDVYEELKEDISRDEYKINGVKEELGNIDEQLIDREQEIKSKTTVIGLENTEILDLHIKIKEYKQKINSMKEVKSALKNVEETYKVLLKDRNIDEIKEEMKEIINSNINYSYESEEEIDTEIRKQSNELLKVEKEIKDLEHLIEKRYIGKREIPEIEEELLINKEKSEKLEKEFKALDLASSTLQEAFNEVRQNIGPELNNKVVNKFNFLTDGTYKEVKISEDYTLKLREDTKLFDGEILSNGAKDQLYLSLRLSIVDMLFKNRNVPIFLDDAFVQYDDKRREKAIKLLIEENFEQVIFFTCQKIEKLIIDKNRNNYNLICL